MEKGANGKLWVCRVTLRPRIGFAPGTSVNAAQLAEIHHKSHEECFIANSVKTDVSVAPQS
jgi:organic hydroperoxide reductase OsmC/OhrA